MVHVKIILRGTIMSPTRKRVYSNYTVEAVKLLGNLIRLNRKSRRMTVQDLADRAGISRGTAQRMEKGDLKCEIGLFFEAASLLGIELFKSDNTPIPMQIERINDKIAVLPKHIHKTEKEIDDDF